ncbi:MAG: hypothetical protein PHW92_04535 [Lutibacter sp.]|nr:hypothetical protein [Lutibacter sp.]
MRTLILLLIIISFSSCEKDNEPVFVSTAFDISYFDQNENDLLNPNIAESYKESDINIYYLLDGIKVKQYQENLKYPEFFFISDEIRDNKYFMRLFPNRKNLDENNRAITYINFGNNVEDKVECEFQTYENSSNIQVVKIWYNDELKYQYVDGSESRWIEIIK